MEERVDIDRKTGREVPREGEAGKPRKPKGSKK
jgi:hypothetical protein